jgi:hypothetical protein
VFIVLFSAAGALPSPGEKVARRAGCGTRAATYDAVLVSDFLMHCAFLSLKTLQNNCVSARIPHQSAARASHADSFSPGEAMAASPLSPQWGDNNSSIGTINENLKQKQGDPERWEVKTNNPHIHRQRKISHFILNEVFTIVI